MPTSPQKPSVIIEPFAVRAKEGARLAGCGLTRFYALMNTGELEVFLDGSARFVTVRSIRARQERQLAAAAGTPRQRPSSRARAYKPPG